MPLLRHIASDTVHEVAQYPVWIAGVWQCGNQQFTDAQQDLYEILIDPDILPQLKTELVEAVNRYLAGVYLRWQRFSFEYAEREKAARMFQSDGYTGTPSILISSFAGNVGLTNTEAADIIIAQADGLRALLNILGAYRMEKYQILNATTEAEARAAYEGIISEVEAALEGVS